MSDDLQDERREQDGDGLREIVGEWPGDESEQQIREALEAIEGEHVDHKRHAEILARVLSSMMLGGIRRHIELAGSTLEEVREIVAYYEEGAGR